MRTSKVLIAAAVTAIMLTACGCDCDKSETETTNVIGGVKAGDSTSSKAEPESEVTETDESDAMAVEITIDNWQQYFDLIEDTYEWRNDFGEVAGSEPAEYIVLKDWYSIAEGSELAIEYTFSNEIHEGDRIDYGYEIGDLVEGDMAEELLSWDDDPTTLTTTIYPDVDSDSDNHSNKMLLGRCAQYTIGYNGGSYVAVRANYQITRIQGTIYIVEE